MQTEIVPLRVVNLWGGPGAGKSTTRARVFHEMKLAGLRVEEATEFAKDLTYAQDWGSLENQLYVLGEQDRRLRRLAGQVDWVVTDSPLPLGTIYAKAPEYGAWFTNAALGAYDRYVNYDFRILRFKAYQKFGRSQSEDEAKALDAKIGKLFALATTSHIPRSWEVPGDNMAAQTIMRCLKLYDGQPA